MGPSRDVATEGGGGAVSLGKFLLCGDIVGVVVWYRYLGVIISNGSEARGISFGVPDTGEKVEGKNVEGQLVAEGGGRHSASGNGDTTAPDLLGKESGDSGGMGGLTDYLQGMCKGYGLRGRGGALGVGNLKSAFRLGPQTLDRVESI